MWMRLADVLLHCNKKITILATHNTEKLKSEYTGNTWGNQTIKLLKPTGYTTYHQV